MCCKCGTTQFLGKVNDEKHYCHTCIKKIIDFDSGQLRGAIRNIISEGSGYKNRAYSLVKEKYSWDNVISEYVSLIDNSQISCC